MGELPLAIGLMSGTSMDGIDAALIQTDGETQVKTHFPSVFIPYAEATRNSIRNVIAKQGDADQLGQELTQLHAQAVQALLNKNNLSAKDISVIGFHGHTVAHAPLQGYTHQVGDGALLAQLTNIDVVYNFRVNDVAMGGQGAPLVPVYHRALVSQLEGPISVVNIGGVANVTWIDKNGDMLAFDTGPGNALMDDWMLHYTSTPYDKDGVLAAQGQCDHDLLAYLMDHVYFHQMPPKSLDRQAFSFESLKGLTIPDGLATLAHFTACSIAHAQKYFNTPAKRWLISGGGRHNQYLMTLLKHYIQAPVADIETIGGNGDMLEAEAFGYLAVRSLKHLPLTYSGTTGVNEPTLGGILCQK